VAKVRVYELAKEFGVEIKAVMAKLEEMGEFVRSASSTIEAPVVQRLREAFRYKVPVPRMDRQAGDRLAVDNGAGIPPVTPTRGPGPIPQFSGVAPDADTELAPALIREVLEAWDPLKKLAPDPREAVSFLAERSKLPRRDIERIRTVRNRCAHPTEQGWPEPYDLDLALATARELRRRLKPTEPPPAPF
jgi:hypothetical protein